MCTVTIVPGADGFRLAANRDESRRRSLALPPRRQKFGGHGAILPIDPHSGGTWIAVNDAGLCLTLLNRHSTASRSPRAPDTPSRGIIIPKLLECATVAAALDRLRDSVRRDFAPFRLVLVSRNELAEVMSDEDLHRVNVVPRPDAPVLFTSSGLGDDVVDGPRRALFAASFSTRENWAREQEAFHRHSWPDRPHLSVCMRREEAHTVSCTRIEADASTATMTYWGGPPDEPCEPVSLTLNFRGRSVSEA